MNLAELYKNNQKLTEQRQKFHDAIKNNDAEGVSDAFTQMCEVIGTINREEYQQQLDGMKQELDNSVLYARGVRQLTNNEQECLGVVYSSLTFSPDGGRELRELFDITLQNLRIAQTVVVSHDQNMARQLMETKERVRHVERASAENHLLRLQEGRRESLQTSSLHLDILRDLKRINAHLVTVAHPILDDLGLLRQSRLREDRLAIPTAGKTRPPVAG